ncbi:MAG: glycosyltransferase family 4 protein [Candidatus Rokubacteria bacterium]|nr:glycosyltransferase family 4 protein [Candidatus Rokubacteria bacterium]
MKAVLVHPYRLGTAGLTTFVLRLQEGLTATGWQALVLVAGDSNRVVPQEGAPGLHAIYLRRMWPESSRLKAFAGFWAMLPLTLWHLWSFLRRERVDVVHLHFTIPASLYFVALRPFSRWKLLATFHGTDGYGLRRRGTRYRLLVRLVLAGADLVTAVSGDLLRTVKTVYPALRAGTRVILNGNPAVAGPLPAAALPPSPTLPDRFVLAVGSLIPRKGYDVLVRAAGLAQDRGHPLDVVVVGDGPEAAALARLARESGVGARVVFAGEMSHAAALQFYPRASFFVHTAREEAFGLVLLEAMSFGKAVIATRVGGIPEFVRHGETGLLVEPDDADALAEAMMRLDTDRALCAALAARGQETALRDYSWDRVVEAYRAAYEDVLRSPSRHPSPATR